MVYLWIICLAFQKNPNHEHEKLLLSKTGVLLYWEIQFPAVGENIARPQPHYHHNFSFMPVGGGRAMLAPTRGMGNITEQEKEKLRCRSSAVSDTPEITGMP